MRELLFSADGWSEKKKLFFSCRLVDKNRQAVLSLYTRIPGGGENDFAPFIYDGGLKEIQLDAEGLPPVFMPVHWILNPTNRFVEGEIEFPENLDIRFYEEFDGNFKRVPLKLKVSSHGSFVKGFGWALRRFAGKLRRLYGAAN